MHEAEWSAVEQAIAGEMRLLDPHVRSSPKTVEELLDPEFFEIDRSGRRRNRAEILKMLQNEQHQGSERVRVRDMVGRLLAPGIVHLTFATEVGDLHALRTSIWRQGPEGTWRAYYHQGTPAAAYKS